MDRRLGLAASIIAGCVAGWFARGAVDTASLSATNDESPSVSTGAPGSLAGGPRATPKAVSTTTASEPPLAERIAKGTTSELSRIGASDPKPAFGAAAVDALVTRLDSAVKAGDPQLFSAVVGLLGLANDPKGDAALIAVAADMAVDLPHPMGTELASALTDSRVPGVAAAARARCERNIAAGETSWTAVAGWFDVVAATGSEADIEWLLALAKQQRQWASRAVDAITKADRHEGAGTILNALRNGMANSAALGVLAKRDPDAAGEVVAEVIRSDARRFQMDVNEVLIAFADNAPERRLQDVERWIVALSNDHDRIAAVSAVESLRRRGYDTSRLSAAADAAVLYVERVAGGEAVTDANRHRLNEAGYAIEYNRTTWSERAASALERAADTLDRAGITVGGPDYREVAKQVRAGLKSRWR
jgi:hypothetical protein